MISLVESILKSTGSGFYRYKLDYLFHKTRNFAFYNEENGMWEDDNETKDFLYENNIDIIKLFNHFWDMTAAPGTRLYKVLEMFLKDKKVNFRYDYSYIWKDEDVEKINKHMMQIGWRVSRPTRKEVNQFNEISTPNIDAYLKLEKDDFMGIMIFPAKKTHGEIYQEIDFVKKQPETKKKWWDKSSEPKNNYYRTKIYFS